MSKGSIRYFPLGESAITVEFGNVISVRLNEKAISLARLIEQRGFPGFIETVPAYCSTTVFYDLMTVRRNYPEFPTAFDAVRSIIEVAIIDIGTAVQTDPKPIEIPVDFGSDAALDLAFVAKKSRLSPDEVIAIFTEQVYRVFMLGFLPGFSYMGEVDERIAVPRKPNPRTIVPKGSVGIAGRQTGIYSLESPGGWQIIGRTPTEMFTPDAHEPTYLNAGDAVRFVAI